MRFYAFLNIFGHFWTFLGDFWKNSLSGIVCNVPG
jgi:hypothetical protein